MDKEYILREIRRTAKDNGDVPLGSIRFRNETGIRESDWRGRFWINWGDAIREAGFEPNIKQSSYNEDWLLLQLATFIRELGHYPVNAEIQLKRRKDSSFPSQTAFKRRGKKAHLATELIRWCEKNKGWDDVQAICAPLAITGEESEDTNDHDSDITFGYVYLLRSGKYYKIGRSNAPGRREYELAIQLPEPVVTIHTIKTDDPVGIEKYWHHRFSDRKKNGEWFELRKQDVSAFRRRKFM